ncbi:MAG: putative PEP-binding protein [Elusimicrobiota bacterium]
MDAQDLTLSGIAASPGIAIGKAYVFEDESFVVTKRRIDPARVAREIKRFKKAIEATLNDLNAVEATVLKTLGRRHARLIETHRLILQDPIVTKDIPQLIEKEQVNAEFALSDILAKTNVAFEAIADEFFRERRHDLFDVGRRILRHLTKARRPEGLASKDLAFSIVVAKNLLPTDTIHLKDAKVLAFVTEQGTRSSHAVILAQSLEIPAVVGAADVLKNIAGGDELIVDGDQGVVHVRPSVAVMKQFKEKQSAMRRQAQELLELTRGPAVTADGFAVRLSANVDALDELPMVRKFGAQGIGLFRTELICMASSKPILLDERAQTEIYRRVLEDGVPETVIIRLLDIGADKLFELGPQSGLSLPSLNQLGGAAAPATNASEILPMGLRGIRLALRYPQILKTQIRSILVASRSGNPWIMLPMVSAIEEVREVRWLLEEIRQELRAEGVAFEEKIPLGIMVEVPSVAIKVEAFLAEVDFISVGTNDLIQYTLACDRASADLAYLYQEFHPSILQLLANVTGASHAMGRWVSICGEMAGNPLALPVILGLGFDAISVNPHLIPKIKKQLRYLSLERSKEIVQNALKMTSYEDVVELLKREMPLLQSGAG